MWSDLREEWYFVRLRRIYHAIIGDWTEDEWRLIAQNRNLTRCLEELKAEKKDES